MSSETHAEWRECPKQTQCLMSLHVLPGKINVIWNDDRAAG